MLLKHRYLNGAASSVFGANLRDWTFISAPPPFFTNVESSYKASPPLTGLTWHTFLFNCLFFRGVIEASFYRLVLLLSLISFLSRFFFLRVSLSRKMRVTVLLDASILICSYSFSSLLFTGILIGELSY